MAVGWNYVPKGRLVSHKSTAIKGMFLPDKKLETKAGSSYSFNGLKMKLFCTEKKISVIKTYNTCKHDQNTVFYNKKIISINCNKNSR